jgi:hypothetical protein
MKQLFILVFICVLVFNVTCGQSDAWKYLGQRPPGGSPKIFAPGIISGKGRMHCFPAISQDLKEIYWMTIPPKIYFVKYRDGRWSDPEVSPSFEEYVCMRPFFSHDNERLYFSSANIPGGCGSLDIWYVERTRAGYSEPINIGVPINTEKLETQQTFTRYGNIYYCGWVEGKRFNRGILYSRYDDGIYSEPQILAEPINIIDNNTIDYTPFIAPDESYLLFSSNRHNTTEEDCRIYLSSRNEAGVWSNPIDLNDRMDFEKDSRDPYVSPDGKYLFFSSGENIYWIDAKIIDIVRGNIN